MATVRDVWVRVALAASLGMVVYFLLAAFGVKFGLLDWRVGFGLMTFRYGVLVILAALGFAVIGLLLALLVPPRRGRLIALLALAIPAAGLGYGFMAMQAARAVPPIHDISTDLADPPQFSEEVMREREAMGANSLDLLAKRVPESDRFPAASGRLFTELQREGYPDIAPIRLTLPPEAAYEKALAAASALQWRIGRADKASGAIEAEVESFWYGFIDDIAVRVRPDGAGGSIVDVRSVSRVGLSDLGANAKRVRAFRDALAEA